MRSPKRIARDEKKADWLRRHPIIHQWLRDTRALPYELRKDIHKHTYGGDLVYGLKCEGIYGPATSPYDICITMSRVACEVEVGSQDPTGQAITDIQLILGRPGVCKTSVLAAL